MMITQDVPTEHAFADTVRDALHTMKRDQAAAHLARIHAGDVDALQSRLDARDEEVKHLVAQATQEQYLAEGLAAAAGRETLRAAQLQARNRLAADMLSTLGALARQSETGEVSAALILETLARPLPRIPFRPHIAQFHPSQQYSYGHFGADEGDVTMVFPFAGWSVVVMASDAPQDRLQPSFLVDGEVFPQCTITLDRGVKLTRLV